MADEIKRKISGGSDDSTQSFILVEWSINKIFTVLQNFKKVQLNELVTCKVNNTKDIGKVIFIGKYDQNLTLKTNILLSFLQYLTS